MRRPDTKTVRRLRRLSPRHKGPHWAPLGKGLEALLIGSWATLGSGRVATPVSTGIVTHLSLGGGMSKYVQDILPCLPLDGQIDPGHIRLECPFLSPCLLVFDERREPAVEHTCMYECAPALM